MSGIPRPEIQKLIRKLSRSKHEAEDWLNKNRHKHERKVHLFGQPDEQKYSELTGEVMAYVHAIQEITLLLEVND